MRSSFEEKCSTEVFFIPGEMGRLFAVLFRPTDELQLQGGILYIHPFAEEMNKSRRMAAVQARAMARLGIVVLLVDLYGCGDSEGEFRESSWEGWQDDVGTAISWLRSNVDGPIGIWGLRFGALLAMDAVCRLPLEFSRVILWQPIITGDAMVREFLRIHAAAQMLERSVHKTTTKELRARLLDEGSLEVAGYELSSSLVTTIEDVVLRDYGKRSCDIHWTEVVRSGNSDMSPARRRVIDEWKGRGVSVDVQTVRGEFFWQTAEVTECEALVTATSAIFKPGGKETAPT